VNVYIVADLHGAIKGVFSSYDRAIRFVGNRDMSIEQETVDRLPVPTETTGFGG
jgi:hypothetical protein